MSGKLKGLKPENVFKHFETLTQIPRGSGNEKAVSDYLVTFANQLGLEVIQEECMNIIINKPGTEGYENAASVILQGHLDIVCTKEEGLKFDFEKDPIDIWVDEDMIRTQGTTLGADNGIAVAMAMAVLESTDMPHPPITALFTVSEETGMDGVIGLQPENIKGDILINIDSEEEGTALSSCAGGVNTIVKLPVTRKESDTNKKAYEIYVGGLLGGHSGIEIDKKRGNAIVILGRVLDAIDRKIDLAVSEVSGGEKMNAIPKMADALIHINKEDTKEFTLIIEGLNKLLANEFKTSDPGVEITVKEIDTLNKVLVDESKEAMITLLRLIPNGIQTMSADMAGLVESSNNIGVLVTRNNEIEFNGAVRSSVRSLKNEINRRISFACKATGADVEFKSDYPEWEFKPNSPIRELMKEVYQEINNKELKIDAIHAGLECGFLKEKVGDIDMISIGPNLFDVHTPNEHLSISSTRRVYEFLCEVLKKIN